jgi:hypothetical protein
VEAGSPAIKALWRIPAIPPLVPHDVLLIDEFDLIDKDLLMYRAFKPEVFRKRVTYLPRRIAQLLILRAVRGGSGLTSDQSPLADSGHTSACSRIPLEEGKPHPIPALMAKARKDWEQLKGRQSKS